MLWARLQFNNNITGTAISQTCVLPYIVDRLPNEQQVKVRTFISIDHAIIIVNVYVCTNAHHITLTQKIHDLVYYLYPAR